MSDTTSMPEPLTFEDGYVIYEPDMGDMEFGIAKATAESNWPLVQEMVRRYNAHTVMLKALQMPQGDSAARPLQAKDAEFLREMAMDIEEQDNSAAGSTGAVLRDIVDRIYATLNTSAAAERQAQQFYDPGNPETGA